MKNKEDILILIVDDNPQNIQVIGNIISEEGYDTGVAINGTKTLNFVLKQPPDLILMDIKMPKMNGYQVCEILKKEKLTQDIPVIFLTAKTETEDIVKGFDAGGVDYVTKPFNSKELLARIKTHVELKLSRDEIKTLKGLIPICAGCKQIRDDKGYWFQVEEYITKNTDAAFTHSICPTCMEKLYGIKPKEDGKENKKLYSIRPKGEGKEKR